MTKCVETLMILRTNTRRHRSYPADITARICLVVMLDDSALYLSMVMLFLVRYFNVPYYRPARMSSTGGGGGT